MKIYGAGGFPWFGWSWQYFAYGRQGKCGISQRSGKTRTEQGRNMYQLKKCRVLSLMSLQNCAPIVLLSSLQEQGAPGAPLWQGENSSIPGICWPALQSATFSPKRWWCSVHKTSLASRMGSSSCQVIWVRLELARTHTWICLKMNTCVPAADRFGGVLPI